MKYNSIIVIGDIHGRDIWEEIVKLYPNSLIIFIGDYLDSLTIDTLTQINNFKSIIEFKKNNPSRVILLFGNHDFHYCSGCIGSYTGFDYSIYYNLKLEIEQLIKDRVLQISYQHENLIFTHAGVTKTFCEIHKIDTENLVNSLNDFLVYKPHIFNFRQGENKDPYGDDINQSPIWVRPKSLKLDMVDNYIHIVGHTSHENIQIELENNFICVDSLRYNRYLEISIESNNEFIFNECEIKK
jgi:predicted MPP superfamily phosphohydrolase